MQVKYDAGVTAAENCRAGYFGGVMTTRSLGMIRARPYIFRSSRSRVGMPWVTLCVKARYALNTARRAPGAAYPYAAWAR